MLKKEQEIKEEKRKECERQIVMKQGRNKETDGRRTE